MIYADSAEGFRPALKLIEDRTGITQNKVSEIRKELVDHGLIAYDQKTIIIDWERMQTFAALNKPLPKHGQHTYAPVNTTDKDWSRIPLYKTKEARQLKYRNPMRKLEEWEKDFFNRLEDMTAEEYGEIIRGMGADTIPPKEGYITIIQQPTLEGDYEPDFAPSISSTAKEDYPSLRFETVEAF